MYRKLALLLFIGLLWAKPVLASDAIQIPLTISATGKLIIDIKVDGTPVTCIIDTGSPSFLLLDEQIVDKQRLPKKQVHSKLRFFAEERGGITYRVQFPEVQIGPLEYENIEGLTLDDVRRATGTGYNSLPNFWAQGILGMGFLENFRVKIDYPHSTLILYPAYNNLKPALYSHIEPIIPVGSSYKTATFLLDTGSTFSIVSDEVMESLGLRYQYIGTSPDRLFRGTARADSINIGPIHYQNPTFEVASHFEEFAGTDVLKGIIGYDYLKDFVLDLDFPQGHLSIEKP